MASDKMVNPADQYKLYLDLFGSFLRRQHVVFPSKIY